MLAAVLFARLPVVSLLSVLASATLASVAGAQEVPAPVATIVPAPQVEAAVPAPPVAPATPDPSAMAAPGSMSFPAVLGAQLPERPDVLPVPAHRGRVWRIVASGAYTVVAGEDATNHGVFTAGLSLATTWSMAGRTGALHLGFEVDGYLLTAHEQTLDFYGGCSGSYYGANVTESRFGYGPLGRIILASRFIEMSLGMGALYLDGSRSGCSGGPRSNSDFWAFAGSYAIGAAVDPGNTVLLRAEAFFYAGDEKVASLSLGLEVHL